MTPSEMAASALKIGAEFPYDAPDAWWAGSGTNPPAPVDWAHAAARGILADLSDRRGIKWSLEEIDEETRREIAETMAEIIRQALGEDHGE